MYLHPPPAGVFSVNNVGPQCIRFNLRMHGQTIASTHTPHHSSEIHESIFICIRKVQTIFFQGFKLESVSAVILWVY